MMRTWRAVDGMGEVEHALPEAVDDGLALAGHALRPRGTGAQHDSSATVCCAFPRMHAAASMQAYGPHSVPGIICAVLGMLCAGGSLVRAGSHESTAF